MYLGLALPRASHSGESALFGSRRLHSMLATVLVLFAHSAVTVAESSTQYIRHPYPLMYVPRHTNQWVALSCGWWLTCLFEFVHMITCAFMYLFHASLLCTHCGELVDWCSQCGHYCIQWRCARCRARGGSSSFGSRQALKIQAVYISVLTVQEVGGT